MRIYSTFGWVSFATDAWYWMYVPVDSATDPVAFEYGGLAWTYWTEGSNCCFETEPWGPGEGEGF